MTFSQFLSWKNPARVSAWKYETVAVESKAAWLCRQPISVLIPEELTWVAQLKAHRAKYPNDVITGIEGVYTGGYPTGAFRVKANAFRSTGKGTRPDRIEPTGTVDDYLKFTSVPAADIAAKKVLATQLQLWDWRQLYSDQATRFFGTRSNYSSDTRFDFVRAPDWRLNADDIGVTAKFSGLPLSDMMGRARFELACRFFQGDTTDVDAYMEELRRLGASWLDKFGDVFGIVLGVVIVAATGGAVIGAIGGAGATTGATTAVAGVAEGLGIPATALSTAAGGGGIAALAAPALAAAVPAGVAVLTGVVKGAVSDALTPDAAPAPFVGPPAPTSPPKLTLIEGGKQDFPIWLPIAFLVLFGVKFI